MSGFYGYMYVGVWYRTTSTLLLLALHAMELKELSPVQGQSLTGVSRDGCVGCVDELSRLRSLPCAPARLFWHGGGSSGCLCCSPAPLGWGGSGHSLPLWQLVLLEIPAGLMVIQALLQEGSRGFKSLFRAWASTSSPCPQQVKEEQHPWEKDGFMGWNLNRGKKLLGFTPRENTSLQIK